MEISTEIKSKAKDPKLTTIKRKKWTRRQPTKNMVLDKSKLLEVEIGKQQLVDVMIIDGINDREGSGEKKHKGQEQGG